MWFIIIGTKMFAWGSQLTPRAYQCSHCGSFGPFIEKTEMRFLTLFFFIPIVPISGKKQVFECPSCKTRFENL